MCAAMPHNAEALQRRRASCSRPGAQPPVVAPEHNPKLSIRLASSHWPTDEACLITDGQFFGNSAISDKSQTIIPSNHYLAYDGVRSAFLAVDE
jgi:hypothetical protein